MRRPNVLIIAALVAAGSAVAWRVGAGLQVGERRATGSMVVEGKLRPGFCPSRALEAPEPGQVRFRLPESEKLTGFSGATICPTRNGSPWYPRSTDVVFLQRPGGLDLREYLRTVRPTGKLNLRYALWVRRGRDVEWRVGWARMDATDLGARGIEVEPLRRESVRVEVITKGGQPVPGARISLDEDGFRCGEFHRYAVTDENGHLTVAGLEEDRHFLLALIDGVGPAPARLVKRVRADEERVRFVVDLPGTWRFLRYDVAAPGPGFPVIVDRVEVPDREPCLWPVSRWVPAGLSPRAPLYLMCREEIDLPKLAKVHFGAFEPAAEVDPRHPGKQLVCRFVKKKEKE